MTVTQAQVQEAVNQAIGGPLVDLIREEIAKAVAAAIDQLKAYLATLDWQTVIADLVKIILARLLPVPVLKVAE